MKAGSMRIAPTSVLLWRGCSPSPPAGGPDDGTAGAQAEPAIASNSTIPAAPALSSASIQVPASDSLAHEPTIERLVGQQLRPRIADRAEHRDPAAKLDFTVGDDVLAADPGQVVVLAGRNLGE